MGRSFQWKQAAYLGSEQQAGETGELRDTRRSTTLRATYGAILVASDRHGQSGSLPFTIAAVVALDCVSLDYLIGASQGRGSA